MWQNFIIPAILNAPQLMRGDIGGYAKNTAFQGGINMGVGSAFPNFNVKAAQGRSHSNLYAIGPILLGERFETTAIPELKEQAYKIAKALTD